jgi:hypothetical protein
MSVNGLQQLQAKIESLPNQTILQSKLEFFRNVKDLSDQLSLDLFDSMQKLNALRVITRSSIFLKVDLEDCQVSVRNVANEISVSLISERPNSDQVSKKIAVMNNAVSNFLKKINTKWIDLCRAHQERVATFKPLVEKLDKVAFNKLREIELAIRPESTALPTTEEGIEVVANVLDSLTTIMNSLKIDGPIETFLQASLNGEGDPRALLDLNLQRYLDEHPAIWRSLKVVLK